MATDPTRENRLQLKFPLISDATKPDPRSLFFLGQGDPDRAFQNVQYLVHFPIQESVPESISRTFERIRTVFIYGFFQYEFFTLSAHLAEITYEFPLGERFVQLYKGNIELRKAKPLQSEQVTVNDLGSLMSLLDRRYGKYPHTRGWRVVDPATGEAMPRWHTSVADRFAWAQRKGLLPGQRPRAMFEHATVNLRHRAAHPASYSFGSPNDAAIAISDLAETINKLWGHDTPGGRLYPGPLHRQLMAPGRSTDGTIVFYQGEDLEKIPEDRRSWEFELILAADNEPIQDLDPNFEMTAYPAFKIAGPCSWQEALDAWRASPLHIRSDTIDYRSRLFVIGVQNGRPEIPRSPAAFLALGDHANLPSRRWYLVKADVSYDARGHVIHELDTTIIGSKPHVVGACDRCPVQTLVANGTWTDVSVALASVAPLH